MRFNISIPDIQINPAALDRRKFVNLFVSEMHVIRAKRDKEIAGGRGADGQDIKPGGYSPGYRAAIRAGTVRSATGVRKVQEEPVNLTISGDMLRARQVREGSDGQSAELAFNEVAQANKAQHLHKRGFLGWHEYGQDDIRRIVGKVDELVRAALPDLVK